MADVRSLLRQQRAARRIDHPNAAYSDAGKLLCTVCREVVRSESLWDDHIRGASHLQRLQAASKSKASAAAKATGGEDEASQSHKRRHGQGDDEDTAMAEDEMEEEAMRKKRSKPDIASRGPEVDPGPKGSKEGGQDGERPSAQTQAANRTPPFTRRTSGTPGHGVELKIPSRPATPIAIRDGTASGSGSQASAGSTPRITPAGRSPLIPQDAAAAAAASSSSSTTTTPATSATAPTASASAPSTAQGTNTQQDIDEAEWAAFEAEVVNAPPTSGTRPSDYTGSAVISAAPMTAEELAARSEEEEQAKRRAAADIQMEDEKEEATRALEEEFEEMEELEARVRRLKEKREALRQQGGPGLAAKPATEEDKGASKGVNGKESAGIGVEEEDEEDVDEDEDWIGFRFRA